MDRYRHLMYYKSLEDDFLVISNNIQVAEDNFKTYSLSLSKLIVSACIEIEIQAKAICEIPKDERVDISKWGPNLIKIFPNLQEFEVTCIPWPYNYIPWERPQKGNTRFWWADYNNIKHGNNGGIKCATLKTALYSLAGLFVTTLFYQRKFYSLLVEKSGQDRIALPQALLPKIFSPSKNNFTVLFDDNYGYDFSE